MKPREWCLIRNWTIAVVIDIPRLARLAWSTPKSIRFRLTAYKWSSTQFAANSSCRRVRIEESGSKSQDRRVRIEESGSKNLHPADLRVSFEDMVCWTICSLNLLAIFVIGGKAFPLPTSNRPEESPFSDASYDYYAETFLGAYTGPW